VFLFIKWGSIMEDNLAFFMAARTMRMLGRENISNALVAIEELVRNSYDADAEEVSVRFLNGTDGKPYLEIEDNGDGMTLSDLKEKWMVIGTDNKAKNPISSKHNRVMVGKKGIGRLSLDRLADTAIIETRAEGSQEGFRLRIDWTKYDDFTKNFHDIKHPLISIQKEKKGTKIVLKQLRDSWGEKQFIELNDTLSLIVPPFGAAVKKFSINIEIAGYPELSGKIENKIENKQDMTLKGSVTKEGEINYSLLDASGKVINTEKTEWIKKYGLKNGVYNPECGPIDFTIYFYLRTSRSGLTSRELGDSLDLFQGIRIYRDFFRVKPYGDPKAKDDWLGLNARRAQSPAAVSRYGDYRIAQNQLIGMVHISEQINPLLQDQTNREGLIKNNAFNELYNFVLDGIRFLELERSKIAIKEKGEIVKKVESGEKKVKDIPSKYKQRVEQSKRNDKKELTKAYSEAYNDINQYQQLVTNYKSIVEDKDLKIRYMQSLATLGISSAVFGHEIADPISRIKANHSTIMAKLKKYDPSEDTKALISTMNDDVDWITNFGRFAINRVKRNKRVRQENDVNGIVKGVVKDFEHMLKVYKIKPVENYGDNIPPFNCYSIDIESVIINFITNACYAINESESPERKIFVVTSFDSRANAVKIVFKDTGIGIDIANVMDIFNPLYSTKKGPNGEEEGVGLGLTIVKETIDFYRGVIEVIPHCDVHGAQFEITLPYGVRE
jgi:signal transduction histidine kinase